MIYVSADSHTLAFIGVLFKGGMHSVQIAGRRLHRGMGEVGLLPIPEAGFSPGQFARVGVEGHWAAT